MVFGESVSPSRGVGRAKIALSTEVVRYYFISV